MLASLSGLVRSMMDQLTEELANQIEQMNTLEVLMLCATSSTSLLDRSASLAVGTLDKLLKQWQPRISDGVMTKLLVKLVIYATTNLFVAEEFLLLPSTSSAVMTRTVLRGTGLHGT